MSDRPSVLPLFSRVPLSLSLTIGALLLSAMTPRVAEAKSPTEARRTALSKLATATPCVPGVTTLCLNNQQFKVEVQWKDFQGLTGTGQAISLTGDTGYFWFFSSSNVELVVKVLDGRPLNGNYWVFYGALSNVEYTMTVTNTLTGVVKTYVNPSGHFGSVGDTSAFPTAGAARSSRASAREIETLSASATLALKEALLPPGSPRAASSGKRSKPFAAASACVATGTSLCLNASRFRVEVAWHDFSGNTGAGTAVALTGDTGYFWFFSSNNVELTVKVLDARTLNGRFWVFYGALSNVQYEMTVTDTLTGFARTYSNPSGQFASVGDTDGFRSGYSVAAQLDDSRTSSAIIPASGGTLSTTGADGTVFTLTVPDGALLSDEEITMTPVISVDRLPMSGGLSAAVEIGPEGLELFDAATLVIQTPAPVPVDSEVTFAWRGTGDEFILFPPNPDAGAAVSLDVFTLRSYGVGSGTPADQTAQQGRPPESDDDQLDQDLQGPASDERKSLRTGGSLGAAKSAEAARATAKTPAQILATTYLQHYFLAVLGPRQPTACKDEWINFLHDLRAFLKKVVRLTGPDTALFNAAQAYASSLYTLESDCYSQAYERCKANKDPAEGETMALLWQAIIRNAPLITADPAKISSCLTFELKFDSTITEPPFPNFAGALIVLHHKVSADVAGLKFSVVTNSNDGKNLAANLSYTPTDDFAPGDSKCTFSESGDDSTFRLASMNLDLNLFPGEKRPSLVVKYDPGAPVLHFTLLCEGVPVSFDEPRWREIYGGNHATEFHNAVFSAEDWIRTGGGDPYAIKHYAVGGETTDIVLEHTPQ